jgi:Rrf2 family protein
VERQIAMLTKTSRSAIRLLTYLGLLGSNSPLPPRTLADQLGESPTYLAKVAGHLVRAGILQSQRGVAGGVILSRAPETITLLAIVEACQGTVLADFCDEAPDLAKTCAFHQACAELHNSIVGVLSRWTLAQFIQKPRPTELLDKRVPCWLEPTPRVVPLRTALVPTTGSKGTKGKGPSGRRSTRRKKSTE